MHGSMPPLSFAPSRPRVHLETAPMNLRQTVEPFCCIAPAQCAAQAFTSEFTFFRNQESEAPKTQPSEAHSLDSQLTKIISTSQAVIA